MFERFTDRARRVVVQSQQEARSLGHNHIGTEHILLGLLREGVEVSLDRVGSDEDLADQVMNDAGISIEHVRPQVEEIIGEGEVAPTGHIPFTPAGKKLLELSLREALRLGHNYIGTEHILLGLLRLDEGIAAEVLTRLGVDAQLLGRHMVERIPLPEGVSWPAPVPPPGRSLPFVGAATERLDMEVRQTVIQAQEEARASARAEVGTEHLLLALVANPAGVAARTLEGIGISVGGLRRTVEEAAGRGPDPGEPVASIQVGRGARRAVDLGLREALAARQSTVGPQHLLLGLAGEGEGVAAQVLVGLGAGPNRVRDYRLPSPPPPSSPSSPPAPPPRSPRTPSTGTSFDRYTDRSRRVIVLAQEEARELNHDHIGTEHLVLAMLREAEGVAGQALASLGFTRESVRRQVQELAAADQRSPDGHIPFSPRARRALELALREALQLGHNYIGTEHLLLGLVREGEGVGVTALVRLGGDPNRVRQQVIIQLSGYRGDAPAPPTVAPAATTRYPVSFERYSDRARRVIVLAQEEARALDHDHIGDEHLLLGLIHEGESIAAEALTSAGVSLEEARQELESISGRGSEPQRGHIPFTDRVRRVLSLGQRESLQLGHNYIAPEHLLLGLIRDGQGVGARLLARLSVDLTVLRRRVIALVAARSETPPATPRAAGPGGSIPGYPRYRHGAQRATSLAQQEARRSDHAVVGTEHLLLGLLREGEGVGAQALAAEGVSLSAARRRIGEMAHRGRPAPSAEAPFTTRARRVQDLALRDALELGHNFIDTEHILLAIVRLGEGTAADALAGLGADLSRLRQRVLALLSERRRRESETGAGGMFERFTDLARRFVLGCQEDARRRGHNAISPEHLLLSMVRDGQGNAVLVLERLEISPEVVTSRVEDLLGHGGEVVSGHIPFTPRAKKVLEYALREALQLGHAHIGTEHILLALIREGDSAAARVLIDLGADLNATRRRVIEVLLGEVGGERVGVPPVVATADDAVAEWARWQAATVVHEPGRLVDLRQVASGVVLLGQSGLHLPLGFVSDVLRLTRGGSPPDERLAALHALPDIQRLRALEWPAPARIGFAALLGSAATADPRITPPPAPAGELRSSLIRAVVAAAPPDEPIAPGTAEILTSRPRITEGTITTLLVVGPASVAADPLLALRLQTGADHVPALTGSQRALLDWSGARAPVSARTRGSSTAPGPGMTGVSRRGQLNNLLPSQLALPPAVLRHRFAGRTLLYRLHEMEVRPPVDSVRILLDTSPPTYGSIGVALRIVVRAIVAALWEARQVPALVYLDQPAVETPVHKPSDLGGAWAHRSLEPVDISTALVAAQRADRPAVLLTQHHLVSDHGIVATADLRLITAQLPGDDPPAPAPAPFHLHLAAEPTREQLAAAVRTALAPQVR